MKKKDRGKEESGRTKLSPEVLRKKQKDFSCLIVNQSFGKIYFYLLLSDSLFQGKGMYHTTKAVQATLRTFLPLHRV